LKGIVDLLLKTVFPVVLTAMAGYAEHLAQKDQLFDLLSNYREYILEVEQEREGSPPCPPCEEER
jgi:hypothetical protein